LHFRGRENRLIWLACLPQAAWYGSVTQRTLREMTQNYGLPAEIQQIQSPLHLGMSLAICDGMSCISNSFPKRPTMPVKHNYDQRSALTPRRPFSNLSGNAQSQFEKMATEMTFTRGNQLFAEGDTPKYVYLVLSGRIKLSVSSREGRTMILRIADAGQVLGLSAALSFNQHEVTAEALEPCRVQAILAGEFLDFLQDYPEAAMEATHCVLREYQVVFNDVCRLGLPATIAGRLANLLLDWRSVRLQNGHDDSRFIVPLTQEEIAGMTGTSRETVSRLLSQFERAKLICIKGASMTVLEPETLAQMAM
jgi:CRP/FNR family transcriptional regulator, cyclic AMP receptor protein